MERIHFMSTGVSDAILVESNGHFMLVDAGEDTDNPRDFPALNLKGYEELVLSYVLKVAADESGKVTLDYIIGTHSHSDHLGGFDTLLDDARITVKQAILKEYDESKIKDYEVKNWDNKEVFEQTVNALRRRNVPINFTPDGTPFSLGNFTVTLFNTEDNHTCRVGENDRSLGVLLEAGGTRCFLAGDIVYYHGDEARVGRALGKIDLLKVAHHSFDSSTTKSFLKRLMPRYSIVTNNFESADKRTLKRIAEVTGYAPYLTGVENGIIAEIHPHGEIRLISDIHK